jgi:hypothetical protein
MSKLIFGNSITILFLLNALTIQAQPLETKNAVLTTVFNKIIYAYGNAKAPPVLEIVPSKTQVKYIASYVSSPSPTIKIDEQLYDICTKLDRKSVV